MPSLSLRCNYSLELLRFLQPAAPAIPKFNLKFGLHIQTKPRVETSISSVFRCTTETQASPLTSKRTETLLQIQGFIFIRPISESISLNAVFVAVLPLVFR